MLDKLLKAILAAAGLLVAWGVAAPTEAAPIAPTAMKAIALTDVQLASFWGKPFPYGYAYRDYPRRCTWIIASDSARVRSCRILRVRR